MCVPALVVPDSIIKPIRCRSIGRGEIETRIKVEILPFLQEELWVQQHPPTPSASHAAASFFARALALIMVPTFAVGLMHLNFYYRIDGWTRNPVEVDMGHVELESDSDTPLNKFILHVHACMAMSFTVPAVFTVSTALLLPRSTWRLVRWLHRVTGRVVAVIWILTSLIGAYFTVVSKHFNSPDRTLVQNLFCLVIVFWAVGVGAIANIAVGWRAVLVGEKKDWTLHAGSMFFGMYWILSSSLDELLLAGAQSYFSACGLGTFGKLVCTTTGQTVQLTALVVGIQRYCPEVLSRCFVQVNVGSKAFRTLALLGALILTYYVPVDDHNSCWPAYEVSNDSIELLKPEVFAA